MTRKKCAEFFFTSLKLLQTFQVDVQRQRILWMKPNQTIVVITGIKNFVFLIDQANASGGMARHVDHFNLTIA